MGLVLLYEKPEIASSFRHVRTQQVNQKGLSPRTGCCRCSDLRLPASGIVLTKVCCLSYLVYSNLLQQSKLSK